MAQSTETHNWPLSNDEKELICAGYLRSAQKVTKFGGDKDVAVNLLHLRNQIKCKLPSKVEIQLNRFMVSGKFVRMDIIDVTGAICGVFAFSDTLCNFSCTFTF